MARRGLDCTLYQLAGDDLPYDSHWENLQKAREWGFKISNEMRICRSIAQVDEIDALHHAAGGDVQTRNDAFGKHVLFFLPNPFIAHPDRGSKKSLKPKGG